MESVKISVSSSSCVDEPTVQSNMPTSELTDNYGYCKKIHKRNFQEKWKSTFPWLLHNTTAAVVYCKYRHIKLSLKHHQHVGSQY